MVWATLSILVRLLNKVIQSTSKEQPLYHPNISIKSSQRKRYWPTTILRLEVSRKLDHWYFFSSKDIWYPSAIKELLRSVAPYNLFKNKPQKISKRASLKNNRPWAPDQAMKITGEKGRAWQTQTELTVFRRKMFHDKTERRETQNLTDPTEQAGETMAEV